LAEGATNVINDVYCSAGRRFVQGATFHSRLAIVAMLAVAVVARAQTAEDAYPGMAPLAQYLMEREAEVALARSAAPESISHDASVMVLTPHGYESVADGTNGFVCLVQRSWAAGLDDPEFWNPRLRAPICLNAQAVRSYLPQITSKTEWALAGRSKAQMYEDIRSAIAGKVLPTPEIGAMCYMMSKQGYLNDRDGHWYPHLMFFLPLVEPATWGAGLPGSPILGAVDRPGGVTVFLVPVGQWSDGTIAPKRAP
jgi:hypothetical protein